MKVTLKRSLIGTRRDHRATVQALGLRKIGDSREVPADRPHVMGQVRKVAYLLEIESNDE